MNEAIHWRFKSFEELNNLEVYDLLQLRNEVFVVGQQCVYQDADGVDNKAFHLCGYANYTLVAYCRIFPLGVAEENACNFGRVAVGEPWRGQGIGRALIIRTQAFLKEHWPDSVTIIHAQNYLRRFYEALGFQVKGGVYDEVGIPHVKMLWKHRE